jgi:hypothetical protein
MASVGALPTYYSASESSTPHAAGNSKTDILNRLGSERYLKSTLVQLTICIFFFHPTTTKPYFCWSISIVFISLSIFADHLRKSFVVPFISMTALSGTSLLSAFS